LVVVDVLEDMELLELRCEAPILEERTEEVMVHGAASRTSAPPLATLSPPSLRTLPTSMILSIKPKLEMMLEQFVE
jgi:hypothetical protein